MSLTPRIKQEYEQFCRTGRCFDYNGMFVKDLIRRGKIKVDVDRWRKELTPLINAEFDRVYSGYIKENPKGSVIYNNLKYTFILRDYFKSINL